MIGPTTPFEHVEKAKPEVVDKAALEKQVSGAPPPGGGAVPEVKGADQAVKDNLHPAEVRPNVEAEAKIQQAAQEGVDEKGGHWIQEQGRAGERASLARLQAGGERVDDLNRHQQNFPLVDVSSDRRIESVKVKGVGENPDKALYDQYRYDFEKLQDPAQTDRAAEALQRTGAQLPNELGSNPSHEQISRYIQDKGQLAVPDDHVQGVRDNIANMARQVPERYGLSAQSATLEQDIQRLAERVQPIGVTSDDIARMQRR
jgi:hypothetical protein